MSRTYRSNPRAKFEYEVGRFFICNVTTSSGIYSMTRPVMKPLSKGGWKEAKRLLSKEDYAHQRTLRGDKLTNYFPAQSVPHWYRNEIEKQYRQHAIRELRRFFANPDYEVMVNEKPEGTEYYYWL